MDVFGRHSSSLPLKRDHNWVAARHLAPDLALCKQCEHDVLDPANRRYRYPFAQCDQCGPRLSIAKARDGGRPNTAMHAFEPCADCRREYETPSDRRFRTQTISCPQCGPRVSLVRFDSGGVQDARHSMLDDIDAACSLLQKGELLAIKGLGGYQIACDATNAAAILRLRYVLSEAAAPLPIMGRDLYVIARYCAISVEEERLLTSRERPAVILRKSGGDRLPAEAAPGLNTVPFMLPTTPLHMLLLWRMNRPVVMAAAAPAGGPLITDDSEARDRLGRLIPYALIHDRRIYTRADDSTMRIVGGRPRVLRRSRGLASEPMTLPQGFECAPSLIATGVDEDAAFCLLKNGEAILSPYQGHLGAKGAIDALRASLCLHRTLFDYKAFTGVTDLDSGLKTFKLAQDYAAFLPLRLLKVQHHHAHIAACMAENGYPLDGAPVLGIAFDEIDAGLDGAVWGGEFLSATYRGFERLATVKPVVLPAGESAAATDPVDILRPHLDGLMEQQEFDALYGDLEAARWLRLAGTASETEPGKAAFSCGLLLQAVVVALGLSQGKRLTAGQAARLLESAADEAALRGMIKNAAYPVQIALRANEGVFTIETAGLWHALLGDIKHGTPVPIIAARFHRWLASSTAAMVCKLAAIEGGDAPCFRTVALTGACFENGVLLEMTEAFLQRLGFTVLTHARVPPNNGGLALGQAVIGAARLMDERFTA